MGIFSIHTALNAIVVGTFLLLIATPAHTAVDQHVFTIYFEVNRAELTARSIEDAIRAEGIDVKAALDSAEQVTITGYTDCSGDVAYNLRLSEKRARAVASAWKRLTNNGLVAVRGVGEEGCDPSETRYNPDLRRVEIVCGIPKSRAAQSLAPPPPVVAMESMPEEDFKAASKSKVGAILPITGLNFHGGRHFPLEQSYKVLEELLQIMKDNPALVIEIQGHVCCGTIPTEDGRDNDTGENKLSENRARFVYDYLVKEGIAVERMSYKGFAETRPLPITLEDPNLESLNRRVEIMIVSK